MRCDVPKMKGTIIVHSSPPRVVSVNLPIDTHAAVLGWGMDLCRAIHEFSRLRKWLLRLVLGRYAYRELVGLRDAIEEDGYPTDYGYELQGMGYHKDRVRL